MHMYMRVLGGGGSLKLMISLIHVNGNHVVFPLHTIHGIQPLDSYMILILLLGANKSNLSCLSYQRVFIFGIDELYRPVRGTAIPYY